MAVVNEIVTVFSFKGSTRKLEKFNGDMKAVTGSIAKYSAYLTALTGAVGAYAVATLKSADATSQLSAEIGIASNQIRTMQGLAEATNSTAQAMTSTLSSLTSKIGDAAQKGNDDFSRLGISVRYANGEVKKADVILNELRGSFSKLSRQEQKGYAEALGIDSSLLKMLNLSNRELTQLTAKVSKFGSITDKQRKQVSLFNSEWGVLSHGLSVVSEQIAVALAPTMIELTQGFSDFLAANKDLFINGISKIVSGVATLLGWIKQLLPSIALITAGFVAWKIATLGLAGAFKLLLTVLRLPMVLITALVLAVDDLWTAFKGGDSVIGGFIDDLVGVEGYTKAFITGMVDFAKSIPKVITSAFSSVKKFIIDVINYASGLIESFKQKVSDMIEAITAPFKAVANWLGGSIGSEVKLNQQHASGRNNTAGNKTMNQNVEVNIQTNQPIETMSKQIQTSFNSANVQLNNGGI